MASRDRLLVRFLACYFAAVFLDSFVPLAPFYAVMMLDNGLSTGDVAFAFSVWSVVAMAGGIPVGILADRVSRRRLMMWSVVSRSAGFSVWLGWPNPAGYAVGYALWGLKTGLAAIPFI